MSKSNVILPVSKETVVIKNFEGLSKRMSHKSSKTVHNLKDTEFNFPDDFFNEKLQIGGENDSVAVVIDGNNLHNIGRSIQRDLNNNAKFSIDFKMLDNILYANFPNCKRKWYITSQIIVRNNNNSEKDGFSYIRGLLDFLSYNRYTVITRDFEVQENDGEEKRKIYPSIDIEITTALFNAAKFADHIIFFGSDKKYVTPLNVLHEIYGKTITVMSTKQSSFNTVADDLCKIDNFVDIGDSWFVERLTKRNHIPRSFDVNDKDYDLKLNF